METAPLVGWLPAGERRDVVAAAGGWPIALRALVAERRSRSHEEAKVIREVLANWFESSLFGGLTDDERDYLLDVGLLEEADRGRLAELFPGVRADPVQRLPAIGGLFEHRRRAGIDTWRLHPLLRSHCLDMRRQRTPERFRSILTRAAAALARRGEPVAALRHASLAGGWPAPPASPPGS